MDNYYNGNYVESVVHLFPEVVFDTTKFAFRTSKFFFFLIYIDLTHIDLQGNIGTTTEKAADFLLISPKSEVSIRLILSIGIQ